MYDVPLAICESGKIYSSMIIIIYYHGYVAGSNADGV